MTTTTLAFDAAVPVEIFQTWVDGRVQDSSTPEQLVVRLSGAAAHALAAAAGPRRGVASDAIPGHDEPAGELGSFFHVVLLRSDLRPVEAWDPVSCGYAALSVPQSTFAFRRAAGGKVLIEMKRKHLPPSKNHGDVMFRLAVRLRVRVAGEFPVCVSTPFRILSKQSITAGRPEPKRKRNPAPTKPFVAPLSQAALDMVATLAAAASSLPPPAVVAATTSAVATPATAPAAPVRRSSRPVRAAALAAAVRVAKRAHDEMDDGDDHDETAAAVTSAGRSTSDASAWSAGDSAPSACSFAAEEAEVLEAAKASLPRPSHGRFRFLPDEDHDDEEEEDDDDEEDEAGIALAGGDAAVGMPRGWSHGSVKDAASSCTTAGARTPLSDTISVEHVEWAADSAFGELPVTGEIASSAFSSSSSSSSSAAAAAAAAFSASSLELPASRRCRILSDAAIMAASASGRFGSFDADEAPDLSHSPLAVAPGASPQLVPSAMFASALAYGAGDLVLPQPAQAFATTLRAALVPIAPHDGQHPSLAWA